MHPDLKIPKAVTTRFTPSLCYGRFPDFRIGSATSPESFIYPPLLFKSCTPIPLPTQMSPLSSPSSSTMSSPVHHASLVNPATHSPALLELIDLKINRPIIGMWPSFSYFFFFLTRALLDYVVDCVVETVDFAMGRPSSSRGRSRHPEHAKFTTFVTNVITRAEITTPTLLASLVYIDRAKPHLHIALEEWALERVFLGAVIVASKVSLSAIFYHASWSR